MVDAPRPRTEAERAASDLSIRIRHDDEVHVFRYEQLTGRQELDLWRATGMTVRDLLQLARRGTSPASAAPLIWLARRQAGEDHLTFDEVADQVTPATLELAARADDDRPDPDGEHRTEGE